MRHPNHCFDARCNVLRDPNRSIRDPLEGALGDIVGLRDMPFHRPIGIDHRRRTRGTDDRAQQVNVVRLELIPKSFGEIMGKGLAGGVKSEAWRA